MEKTLKPKESFEAVHNRLLGYTIGNKVVLPACQFVVKTDRKTKELVLCGFASECYYRIETAITQTILALCSQHATKIQQMHPDWKLFRVEK